MAGTRAKFWNSRTVTRDLSDPATAGRHAACTHTFVTVAEFTARGARVDECSECGKTRTTWLPPYASPVASA